MSVPAPRVIVHLDMDAFYASIEVRDNPALAGKPVIIGHPGRRGVVSTCSYEARKFGVHSAMPSVTAGRLCPNAVWVSGRMRHYVAESKRLKRILREYSPRVEPISIDEAFVDLTGISASLDAGVGQARRIKAHIRGELGLTGSIGLASNKFLAKVASDMDKPDGLVVLPHEALPEKLWPLPVRRLWGVGPKTAERLNRGGIREIGDLLKIAEADLATLIGDGSAAHLRALARGEDDRPVRTRHHAKSVSEERTYGEDLRTAEEIDRAFLARAEGVARTLRRSGLVGRTVHIKVRTGDFTTWTRSLTLAAPTNLAEPLLGAAREMFRERIDLGGLGVRLLGLGVSGLDRGGSGQAGLFVDPADDRARRIARATDAVRNRLGDKAVTRARLLRREGDRDDDDPRHLPSVD